MELTNPVELASNKLQPSLLPPPPIWRQTLAVYVKSKTGQRVKHNYFSRFGQLQYEHDLEIEHAVQLGRDVPQEVLDDLFIRFPQRLDDFNRNYGKKFLPPRKPVRSTLGFSI